MLLETNKIYLILLLTLITTSKCFGQAQIMIDSLCVDNRGSFYLDLGDNNIDSSKIFVKRITIKNVGNYPLIISRCLTGDGGSYTTWTKEPILPKKYGYIDFHQDTSRRMGRSLLRSIDIESNSKLNPTLSFELRFRMMQTK